MNNRELYLKDNVNCNELARRLASYLEEKEIYNLKTLATANKIVSFFTGKKEER